MFDDQSSNLRIAKNYGMETVLCNKDEDNLQGVDHITKHLNQDLLNIVSKIKGRKK